jgi:hypothetical protein
VSVLGHRASVSVVLADLALLIIVGVAVVALAVAFAPGTVAPTVAPAIGVSHATVTDGGEVCVAIAFEGGESVRIDRLSATGSRPVDVGNAPGTATAADDADASRLEPLTESVPGAPPQVGVGSTWEVGETVYVDPAGRADGVTVRLYWSSTPVSDGGVGGGTAVAIVAVTV